MLAQISNVTPSAWHQATLIGIGVLMLLIGLSGAVVGWLSYAQSRKHSRTVQTRTIEPQPLEVSVDDPFVHQSTFERELRIVAERHVELAQRVGKIDTRVDAAEEYGKQRRQAIYTKIEAVQADSTRMVEKLHDKVNPLVASVAALTEATQNTKATVAVLDGKMNRVIEKLGA